ncbi:hypothetical protein T10_12534 [Trichinella papuae]|uniref:Uncharacterized protein n=1 Tax=Trichinella papuae TaxID=268474 RepID=A0A0V1MWL0_9BILA|nr:hypothetical protein T10_12534 [Trichinella papuae]
MSKTFDVPIGSNYYYNFIDQKIKRGNECEPIAVYSTLGCWDSGPAKESSQVTHVTTLYVKVEYQAKGCMHPVLRYCSGILSSSMVLKLWVYKSPYTNKIEALIDFFGENQKLEIPRTSSALNRCASDNYYHSGWRRAPLFH